MLTHEQRSRTKDRMENGAESAEAAAWGYGFMHCIKGRLCEPAVDTTPVKSMAARKQCSKNFSSLKLVQAYTARCGLLGTQLIDLCREDMEAFAFQCFALEVLVKPSEQIVVFRPDLPPLERLELTVGFVIQAQLCRHGTVAIVILPMQGKGIHEEMLGGPPCGSMWWTVAFSCLFTLTPLLGLGFELCGFPSLLDAELLCTAFLNDGFPQLSPPRAYCLHISLSLGRLEVP